MTLAVAVLAGGASRRMGRDKASLTMAGESLLHRTARIAGAIGSVVVVGRPRPDGWDLTTTFIADDRPGEGPLAAIATALAHAAMPTVALACDLPRLDTAALDWLIEAWRSTPAPLGLVSTRDGRGEPLFSIYMPAARGAIDAALARGERSVQRVISDPGFARREAPAAVASALDDCDDPDDWQRLGGDPA